jgi:peptidoglycan/LPS O-acetylase OafA/YrhL
LTIPLTVTDFYYQGFIYNFCDGSIFKIGYIYILTTFFLQTWFSSTLINVPLWSICSQFFCYTLFPTLVGPFHTVRNTTRFVSEITLFWQFYAAMFMLLLVPVNYMTAHLYPTQSLPLFLIGCIFGSQALTNLSVIKTEKYIKQWNKINNTLTILITVIWITQISLSFNFEGAGIISRIFGEIFLPPVYGIWLYSFTQAPDSLASIIFNMDIFQTLGNYSFSIYCFHFPIMQYYVLFR